MKEWVVLCCHKRSALHPVFLFQGLRPAASSTLCLTALAWPHPMPPVLVSDGPEGVILHRVFSSLTAGTPPIFPIASSWPAGATSPASHAAPALSVPPPQILASARTKRLGADIPPARPPAQPRVERPHGPFPDARAIRRRSLSLPQAARRPRLRAQTMTGDGELEDKDEALAVPGFRQLTLYRDRRGRRGMVELCRRSRGHAGWCGSWRGR